MTSVFAGLIIRLDTADVSISDLEHNSIETLKTEKTKAIEKGEQHIQEKWDTTNGVTYK